MWGMNCSHLAATSLCVLAMSGAASGQDAAVYQPQQKQAFRFAGDSLARYEWTKDIPTAGVDPTTGDETITLVDVNRYVIQVRPRLELTMGPVQLGAGGAFNYSDDENDKGPDGVTTPPLIRDNYRSRDARLDLAWGKLTLGPVVAQGGRFIMPIPFTEMIWDRDLRPQGGAASVTFGGAQSSARFSLHGIYATGSHVFEDQSAMYGGAAQLSLGRVGQGTFDAMGAYLEFNDLNKLEPAIRRQNTRLAGLIVGEYKVVDLIGRLNRGGQVPTQFVIDYCWNTAINTNNKGLWLAAVLGAVGVSPAQLSYTYAKLDKDATVAAFTTDDFFWGTGWEGHRGDIGVTTRKNNSIHAIAQWQRFKDNPDPLISQQWVRRWRLEWRTNF
jgi:hypothetical protein